MTAKGGEVLETQNVTRQGREPERAVVHPLCPNCGRTMHPSPKIEQPRVSPRLRQYRCGECAVSSWEAEAV